MGHAQSLRRRREPLLAQGLHPPFDGHFGHFQIEAHLALSEMNAIQDNLVQMSKSVCLSVCEWMSRNRWKQVHLQQISLEANRKECWVICAAHLVQTKGAIQRWRWLQLDWWSQGKRREPCKPDSSLSLFKCACVCVCVCVCLCVCVSPSLLPMEMLSIMICAPFEWCADAMRFIASLLKDTCGCGWLNVQVSDQMLRHAKHVYPYNTPLTKEAYFYRMIFEKYFPQVWSLSLSLSLPSAFTICMWQSPAARISGSSSNIVPSSWASLQSCSTKIMGLPISSWGFQPCRHEFWGF